MFPLPLARRSAVSRAEARFVALSFVKTPAVGVCTGLRPVFAGLSPVFTGIGLVFSGIDHLSACPVEAFAGFALVRLGPVRAVVGPIFMHLVQSGMATGLECGVFLPLSRVMRGKPVGCALLLELAASLPVGPCSLPVGPCSLPGGPCSLPGGPCSLPGGLCSLSGGPCSLPGGPVSLSGVSCVLVGVLCSLPVAPCLLPVASCSLFAAGVL